MIGDAYRLPACSGGDGDHRHGSGCLPLLVRSLPSAPEGWRWGYGRTGSGWGFWLERIGGGGARWMVSGLPSASTVGALASIVEAFALGARFPLSGLP